MKKDKIIQVSFHCVTNIVDNIKLYEDMIEDLKACTKGFKKYLFPNLIM